jgi:hypothetical protein
MARCAIRREKPKNDTGGVLFELFFDSQLWVKGFFAL